MVALGCAAGAQPETPLDIESFRSWPQAVREWLFSQDGGGLTPVASTVVPSAVRILITPENGGAQSCSGVLVGSMHVLTAGHCVCGLKSTELDGWFHPTAQACRPTLSKLTIDVVIPSEGIVRVRAAPEIPDQFRSPESSSQGAMGRIADLAMITLPRAVRPQPAVLDRPVTAATYVLASFGYFSLTNLPADAPTDGPFKALVKYDAGIGQLSIQRRSVYLRPSDCGPRAAPDSLCVVYPALPAVSGEARAAGACGGDSGGPIYLLETGGVRKLVGIASYYSPGGTENCDARVSQYWHFVNLAEYASWIQGYVRNDPPPPGAADCGEQILSGPGTYRLSSTAAQIVVTPVIEYRGPERPQMQITGVARDRCTTSKEFGLIACLANRTDRPAIIVLTESAVATVCRF
jgi:hypothetical protein